MVRNLVFEGGGVKGIAYGGALKMLKKYGFLSHIEKVAGTSAGAITAVLLSIGYTVEELSKIISETNFNEFMDDDFLYLRDIYRLISEYGVYKGDAFTKWMGDLICAKTGNPDTTFDELKKEGCFLDLYLTASNISKQKPMILSHIGTPYLPIKLAARMSMSIPLFFKAVKYKNDIIVDGGVTYNYPINLFDINRVFNPETLGFRLDTKEEITHNIDNWENVPSGEINNIVEYSKYLIGFMMDMANKKHLSSKDKIRTIFIDTLDVGTTDFDLTKSQIDSLLKSGEDAVIKWVENGIQI